MAKKPFRQLSPATQRRIRSYAAKEGLTVRQVRASTARSQAARGHGATTPSRAGGAGESAARRAAETHRAEVQGRLTSSEVQKVRAWYVRRALKIGKSRAEGEAAYRSVIGSLREHPYSTWEEVRDHIETYPGGTAGLAYQHGTPGLTGDDQDEAIDRSLAGELADLYGVDFDDDARFLAAWQGSPRLPRTRQQRRAA